MELLYTDAAMVVCVKPVGVDSEQGLTALLSAQLPGSFYPVHRLDTAVGGVLVMARTEKAAAVLSEAVRTRRLVKEYRAVVSGRPEEGVWEDLLFWDSRRRKSFPVARPRKGVKEARLTCRVLAEAEWESKRLSLLALVLDTGRTHQIRVQCASRRHPLLGDGKYGSRERRCTPALWAYRLTLPHPETGEMQCFSAPPPATFPFDLFEEMSL
ncbi:MAG: RluA family pseudouridine synthase [Clostridia bacterium]|nr:RluA family pseudouridine synthase [Clostridia bacterium]